MQKQCIKKEKIMKSKICILEERKIDLELL